jgi:hypothetical protein
MKSPAIRTSVVTRKHSASFKTAILLSVSVLILGFAGCYSASRQQEATTTTAQPVAKNFVAESVAKTEAHYGDVQFNKVSLSDTEKLGETAAAIDRKIIRNAELTLEVPQTTETQQRIAAIADAHGGFVVTSEAKQREGTEASQRTLDIKLVVRIPENQFGAVIDQIRGIGGNVSEAKISGQDVTEDFIDLEARIKTQKALEQQFLQIMKQAYKVEDAMEVQRQIADVRTDIEKLEGRKRFLENRSSLSTITVNIITPKPMVVVPTTGFRHSVAEAVSESIDVGSAIVLFFVRFAIVMVPVAGLVLLPAGLLVRYGIRRAKRMRLAEALSATPAE